MLHLKFSTQLALPERQLRRGCNQQGHRCPGRELARSATGRWRRRPEVGKEEGGVRRSSNWGSEICSFQCPLPRSTDQIAGFRKRMQMTSAKTKGENEIKIGEKNVCMQGDSSHLGLVLRFPSPASIPQVPPSPPSPNPRGSRKSEMARWMRDERETIERETLEREWGQEWTRRRVLCLSEMWDQ